MMAENAVKRVLDTLDKDSPEYKVLKDVLAYSDRDAMIRAIRNIQWTALMETNEEERSKKLVSLLHQYNPWGHTDQEIEDFVKNSSTSEIIRWGEEEKKIYS